MMGGRWYSWFRVVVCLCGCDEERKEKERGLKVERRLLSTIYFQCVGNKAEPSHVGPICTNKQCWAGLEVIVNHAVA